MIDFVLYICSNVLGMNMRDHHDIPFALPMILAIMAGFIAAALIFHFVGNDDEETSE